MDLLDNTPSQTFKFRTKSWTETNDDLRGNNNTNSQINLKTSMLKSSLYDYSDAYILVIGTILRLITIATFAAPNNNDKQVLFKIWVPFIIVQAK